MNIFETMLLRNMSENINNTTLRGGGHYKSTYSNISKRGLVLKPIVKLTYENIICNDVRTNISIVLKISPNSYFNGRCRVAFFVNDFIKTFEIESSIQNREVIQLPTSILKEGDNNITVAFEGKDTFNEAASYTLFFNIIKPICKEV